MIELDNAAVAQPPSSIPVSSGAATSLEGVRSSRAIALRRTSGAACIWISALSPGPLISVGEAVQQLLNARHVPTELVCGTSQDAPEGPIGPPTGPELIDQIADAVDAMTQRDVTAVVVGPVLDSGAAQLIERRTGRLIRVSLNPAVVEGGLPPIPTIYWFVEGPRILERAILPRIVESAERADIVVGGALRPPGQLADEIVDGLFRSGWLAVPILTGPARRPSGPVRRDP